MLPNPRFQRNGLHAIPRVSPVQLGFCSDSQLLRMRLRDLDLRIEGTWVERALGRLAEELADRGLRLKLRTWVSDEFFCPDGVVGFAVPFYLLHPRLMKLEQRFMREVEGGTLSWCMKLLRHEAGHAICNAWRLHRKPAWQRLFGRASAPYPPQYRPRPDSRSHVLHLDFWYAQSHPLEDFAETFAVWLGPRERWRRRYAGWPAIEKLEWVDEVMGELAGTAPPVRSGARVDPLPELDRTLREHYRRKRETYGTIGASSVYDGDLRQLFPRPRDRRGYESAAAFLRRNRRAIRDEVRKWTPDYGFALDHVLREMMLRCRRLKLRRAASESRSRRDFALLLTARTVKYLHTSRDFHAL